MTLPLVKGAFDTTKQAVESSGDVCYISVINPDVVQVGTKVKQVEARIENTSEIKEMTLWDPLETYCTLPPSLPLKTI